MSSYTSHRCAFFTLAFLALLQLVASSVRAQTVQFDGMEKRITYVQFSTATPIISTNGLDPNGPYHFSAEVIGTNLANITAPTLTLPDSSNLSLVYKVDEQQWGFHDNVPATNHFSTKGAMDAAFPNGSYSLTVDLGGGPVTTPLFLSPDSYPVDIPTVTTDNWSGGNFLVNAAAGQIINFNALTTYSSGLGGFIQFHLLDLLGNDIDDVMSIFAQGDPAITSYTIAPGLLDPNQFYYGELSYGMLTTADSTTMPGAFGFAIFEDDMAFTISTAVPEPATNAALFGLASAAAVLWERRRRLTKI